MKSTISIKEYDKLHIRSERDLERHIISTSDAAFLQRVVIDNSPIFSFGNRCLVAQQYVGVVELPDFCIEILPKLYGEVDNNDLRDVLIRMLLVAHQTNSIRKFKASVSVRKNSLVEIIIQSFLQEMRQYVSLGLQHEYKKISQNKNRVKGQIVFSQQLRRNVLAPTRFYCRFSKYIADYDLNRFFKSCLLEMAKVSRDKENRRLIDDLSPFFDDILSLSPDSALGLQIEFNSVNSRAKDAYMFGKLFLENIHATMNAGEMKVYTMLFNMEQLYELFVYRVAAIAFGNRVTYQKMGNHLLIRNSDGKKFISLRPDLTLKVNGNTQWIIDTKWKVPGRFAKESDAYQMNAYSTAINDVSKVVLLYPRVAKSDHLVGAYTLNSSTGGNRLLEILLLDLMKVLSWKSFLSYFKQLFTQPESSMNSQIIIDNDTEPINAELKVAESAIGYGLEYENNMKNNNQEE